jgi:predicted Zn-dependent protease
VNVEVTTIPWYITEIIVGGNAIPINSSTIWTDAMRYRLRDYYYNDVHPNIQAYDYVQFVLVGEVEDALGIADGIPARDSWVSQSAGGRTYPHELGHCLGLYHRNTDKDALMAQTWVSTSDSSRKLRVGEWNALH